MEVLDILNDTADKIEVRRYDTEGESSTRPLMLSRPSFPLIDAERYGGQPHVIQNLDAVRDRESPLPTKQWSIFKVPPHVREVEESDYRPRIVAIGPYHCMEPCLQPMEPHKLRFLHRLLQRTKDEHSTLSTIEDAIKELEGKARKCYSENLESINSHDFTRMMVVDGCFLVELLLLSGLSYQGELADDPVFATHWMLLDLRRDLLLLENQIPFFVLQKIFELTLTNSTIEEKTSLNRLALQFLEPMRPGKDIIVEHSKALDSEKQVCLHLLALFQSSFGSNDYYPSPNYNERPNRYNTFEGKGWIYGANVLSNAGVKFKKKCGNVLDIEFHRNVLIMPTFFLDNNTSTVLRNLVAYEQCNRSASPYLTSLVVFLSNILGKTEDVPLLKEVGIIRKAQGDDEEVVQLFSSLTKGLVFDKDKSYYSEIIELINKYYYSKKARFITAFHAIRSRIKFLEIIVIYLSVMQTVFLYMAYVSSSDSASPAPASAP